MKDKYKIDEVEKEILAVFEQCRKEGLTREEIISVFSPLGITKAVVAQYEQQRQKNNKKKEKIVLKCKREWIAIGVIILSLGLLGYWMYFRENTGSLTGKDLRFQLLSVFRIALIKILPLWKWTELYYSQCLVRNPFYVAQDLSQDDCNLCEILEDIDRIMNASQTEVIEQYIRREKPFVVTDAMTEWPIMKTDLLWFDNVTEIYMHQDRIYVCNLNTNLRVSYGDFNKVLKKLYSPHTTQWFLHWENCQKDGAKAARQFYRRPYFISNSLDFTGSNWFLLSSDFKGRVYKKIDPSETLMLMYQIRGFNHIRLSPRDACRDHCPELLTTLNEGEILVVENLLWVMEYIPGEYGDNLAIIAEVSWPSLE